MSGRETTSVHRIGFTKLAGRDSPVPGSYEVNIIFIHGLRGHPQTTWEDNRNEKDERAATPSKRTIFKKLFDSKRAASTASNDSDKDIGTSVPKHKVFWPRDFLTEDIPEATVWTYGYNADVIGGLFAANNQNSVSQHGRDLAVKLEREVPSEVVDDFSSKVGLPRPIETVESIDANHMDIARCGDKSDIQYRAIVGVLKQFILTQMPYNRESRFQESALATASATRVIGQVRAAQDEAELSQSNTLKNKLFIQKTCQKLAVVGLGGVGKTQVALQLAYWVKETQSEYSIFWVPALSDGSFDQAYTEIARRLDIRIQKDDELKETVRRHLESERAGKWLLVVDNADDMDTLFGSPNKPGGIGEHLPENENGLTLFTTRSREVAVSLVGGDFIDLEEMSSEEAMGFFLKGLTQKPLDHDKAVIMELLQELAHLPLAIAQAAAYLNTNQIPIKRYLGLLRGAEQDMVGLMSREFRDNTRYSEHWVASAYLNDRRTKDAIEIFEHVVAVRRKTLKEEDHFRLSSEHELAGAYLDDGRIKDAIEIFKHVVAIRRETLKEEDHSRLTSEHELARAYLDDRRVKDAIEIFDDVVAVRRKTLKEKDHFRLSSEHELARAYLGDGRIKDAIEIFKHVVAIRRKTLKEEDHFRLASEHVLARAYLDDGRIKDAIEIFEHVVAVRRKNSKEKDHFRLASEHELARAYLGDRRVKDAIEILVHVTTVKASILDADDQDRVVSQELLTGAYSMLS
ncbi:hypothetical protein DL768_002381 [Monosporascus sp. mg162]|nr:hypothetical protein DL768_002381 [Monosporascus sp. mg162]